MLRKALRSMAFSSGLALVACGGEDRPAEKYPTSDAFCAAKAAAECAAVAASCSVTDERCKDVRKSACNTAAGAATGQGRTYRASNAEACITKTSEVYASRTIDSAKEAAFDEACERVFAGSKKLSEACVQKYDCEGSIICDTDKGFCAQPVSKKEREPCNNPGDICGTGLYCQPNGASNFCATKNKLGESCNATMPCLEDLRCNGTSCVVLEAAGEPCDSNDQCSTGFCNADRKCQAKQYASETGTCKDFGQ